MIALRDVSKSDEIIFAALMGGSPMAGKSYVQGGEGYCLPVS